MAQPGRGHAQTSRDGLEDPGSAVRHGTQLNTGSPLTSIQGTAILTSRVKTKAHLYKKRLHGPKSGCGALQGCGKLRSKMSRQTCTQHPQSAQKRFQALICASKSTLLTAHSVQMCIEHSYGPRHLNLRQKGYFLQPCTTPLLCRRKIQPRHAGAN